MLSADLSEGFSGLKQWSEPVIFDRLVAAYYKLIRDRELAAQPDAPARTRLARPHRRRHGGFRGIARDAWSARSSPAISRSIIWRKSTARS